MPRQKSWLERNLLKAVLVAVAFCAVLAVVIRHWYVMGPVLIAVFLFVVLPIWILVRIIGTGVKIGVHEAADAAQRRAAGVQPNKTEKE